MTAFTGQFTTGGVTPSEEHLRCKSTMFPGLIDLRAAIPGSTSAINLLPLCIEIRETPSTKTKPLSTAHGVFSACPTRFSISSTSPTLFTPPDVS